MAFAANLLENEILVVPRWGICTVFKPHRGVLYEPPGPTVGHLQLFNVRMTNAQRQMPGGWREWARLELTEPL